MATSRDKEIARRNQEFESLVNELREKRDNPGERARLLAAIDEAGSRLHKDELRALPNVFTCRLCKHETDHGPGEVRLLVLACVQDEDDGSSTFFHRGQQADAQEWSFCKKCGDKIKLPGQPSVEKESA